VYGIHTKLNGRYASLPHRRAGMGDDERKDTARTGPLVPASRRSPTVRREGAIAIGATAVGALVLGAIALSTLAIGKAAIGQLSLGRASARRGQVEDLVIARLTIREPTIERVR
jgi:hypothetical protein